MFTSHHQLWPKKSHFRSCDFLQSLGTKLEALGLFFFRKANSGWSISFGGHVGSPLLLWEPNTTWLGQRIPEESSVFRVEWVYWSHWKMSVSASLWGISLDVSAESLWTHRPKLKNVLTTFHVYWLWCYWLCCLKLYSWRKRGRGNQDHLSPQTALAQVCTQAQRDRPTGSNGSCQGPAEPCTKIVAVEKSL